jgi:hypothetical protein
VLPAYASITDLRTNNINVKLNPNSQDAINIMQEWNAYVQSVNGVTQISTISSDVDYSGNLLIYTRIQEVGELQQPTIVKTQDPSTKFIKNTVTSFDKKGKPQVKVILPATLYTRSLLSVKVIPQELSANLWALFLPTLRLDVESSEDQITQAAWQTYTGEVCTQPYTFGQGQTGVSMTSRAFIMSGHIITQQFAPTNEQDSLAQAMQQLAKYSWGADLFGQIASGILGMIPIVGPALSSVVQTLF